MNNKERGERIRRQIVRDVRHHPTDISKHIAKIFCITPQAVNSHVKRLEKEGWIISNGIGKGKRYFLGDLREYRSLFPLTPEFTEDGVWRNQYSFVFDFDGVSAIGQAFADEIFRVYAKKHPDIVLLPINMEKNVEKMVNRAMPSMGEK